MASLFGIRDEASLARTRDLAVAGDGYVGPARVRHRKAGSATMSASMRAANSRLATRSRK